MTAADYGSALRQCLLDVDVALMRKLWSYTNPHLPPARTDEEIRISIHYARTLTKSIGFKDRVYSHAWLAERALPSGLPDRLRPRAERMYPRVVSAVAISVNFLSPEMRPIKEAVQRAMENAVLEVHADGKIYDTPLVKQRMEEARARVFKELMSPLRGE
jgi:hypothetical protein